jgi:DNA-binding NtrC family response regulator
MATQDLRRLQIMGLFRSSDWTAAEAIAGIFHVNPFGRERIKLERQALATAYKEEGPFIRARPGEGRDELLGNFPAMSERAEAIVSETRRRIEGGRTATREELLVYEDLALFLLYARHLEALESIVARSLQRPGWDGRETFMADYQKSFRNLFHLPGHELPSRRDSLVVFAWLFQVERAFTHIYSRIIGGSKPVARLREAIWESIFTRDMRRYVRSLHRTMADVPTLIVGPSGSGKELVAHAIGRSCFIPFDPEARRFLVGKAETFVPLNIAALAPGLIESELFGHVRGSFAGAYKDRKGWLEQCGEYGAVFLDEIGELDAAIQVKLLRVLEFRRFQRVGDTDTLTFKGKIIAATNRNLEVEMHAGRFRDDLYYRLCADQIVTPSLAEQLADRPEDLAEMVGFIARRVLVKQTDDSDSFGLGADSEGVAEEAERLTAEVVAWIDRELGPDYPWRGNFRELGHCVRNVMIRGSYRPLSARPRGDGGLGPIDELLHRVRGVEVTADELLARYYAIALDQSDGNYRAAGRRVSVDWRVVRDRHDPAFLEDLRCARAVVEP